MSSILTNTAALAALNTLRQVDERLVDAQGRVSSGLRVQAAQDNSAYWSISTTMRSDNSAIGAVVDALGLGAAKIDATYEALQSSVRMLSRFRAKLVAASEPGVDPTKIQKELDEMKSQFQSLSTSASFGGVNWLNTREPQNLLELSSYKDEIVSHFIREQDGAVKVGTTKIDVAELSLFNAGGGGALQNDPRSLGDIGGFRNAVLGNYGNSGYQLWPLTGLPLTLAPGDSITIGLNVDGAVSGTLVIDKALIDSTLGVTNGTIAADFNYMSVLNQAMSAAGLGGYASPIWAFGQLGFRSNDTTSSNNSSISMTAPVRTPAGPTGFGAAPAVTQPGTVAGDSFGMTTVFQVYRDVAFSFNLNVNGTIHHLTVDRPLVDSVLGTSDGKVLNANSFAQILDSITAPLGVRTTASGMTVGFRVDTAMYPQLGTRSYVSIDSVTDNIGPSANFDLLDVDITDPANSIDNYIAGLDGMLKRVTNAATTLGATKLRTELQTDLAELMRDVLDKGISRLVDADMNEASTRVKALQTQQQLAVQSLQIANANAKQLLSLFRQE